MTTAIELAAQNETAPVNSYHSYHSYQGGISPGAPGGLRDVLERVRRLGIDFVVDGARLRWHPRVDDDLRAAIIHHKPALMEWLKRGDTVKKIRVPWASECLWLVPRAEPGGLSEHDTVEELAATGIPRGAIWTESELGALLAAGVRGAELQAVALARLQFDGDLVGIHHPEADRGPSGYGRLHNTAQASPRALTGPAAKPRDTETILL